MSRVPLLHPDAVAAGAPAIFDVAGGRWWSYAELAQQADALANTLTERGARLAVCWAANDMPTVLGYLAALAAGVPVVLLDRATPEDVRADLRARYRPDLELDAPDGGTASPDLPRLTWRADRAGEPACHPELALLLTTSGSTGSPKLVRLARRNVEANARSIAQALAIGPDDRPITSLPVFYSFGLSVLNSHLVAGATLVLTAESVVAPTFWAAAREHACTSLAGVPYSYQMLHRLRIERLAPPSLRTLQQAGGRMQEDLILAFHQFVASRGGRLFVMYGQTEATARIAYLPPDCLPDRVGTVGVAVPGGTLALESDGVLSTAPGAEGEVVYDGPNVMLGYATERADLALGDELGGRLHTGDLGRFEPDGLLRITGRSKRIGKVFGVRVNLDEVEDLARAAGPVAVVDRDDRLVVYVESPPPEDFRLALARRLRVHPTAVEVRVVDALPRAPNGKIEYRRLTEPA